MRGTTHTDFLLAPELGDTLGVAGCAFHAVAACLRRLGSASGTWEGDGLLLQTMSCGKDYSMARHENTHGDMLPQRSGNTRRDLDVLLRAPWPRAVTFIHGLGGLEWIVIYSYKRDMRETWNSIARPKQYNRIRRS